MPPAHQCRYKTRKPKLNYYEGTPHPIIDPKPIQNPLFSRTKQMILLMKRKLNEIFRCNSNFILSVF